MTLFSSIYASFTVAAERDIVLEMSENVTKDVIADLQEWVSKTHWSAVIMCLEMTKLLLKEKSWCRNIISKQKSLK